MWGNHLSCLVVRETKKIKEKKINENNKHNFLFIFISSNIVKVREMHRERRILSKITNWTLLNYATLSIFVCIFWFTSFSFLVTKLRKQISFLSFFFSFLSFSFLFSHFLLNQTQPKRKKKRKP